MDLDFTDDEDDTENAVRNYEKVFREANVKQPLSFSNTVLQNDRFGVDKFVFNKLVWNRIKPKEDVLLKPEYENDPYEEYGDIVDSIPRLQAKASLSPPMSVVDSPSALASRRERLLAILTPVHETFNTKKTARSHAYDISDDDDDDDIDYECEEELGEKDEDKENNLELENNHIEVKNKSITRSTRAKSDEEPNSIKIASRLRSRTAVSTESSERLPSKERCPEYNDDMPLIFLLPEHKRKIYECKTPKSSSADSRKSPESLEKSVVEHSTPRPSKYDRTLRKKKTRFSLTTLYEDSDAEIEVSPEKPKSLKKKAELTIEPTKLQVRGEQKLVKSTPAKSETNLKIKRRDNEEVKVTSQNKKNSQIHIKRKAEAMKRDHSDDDDDETLDFFIDRRKKKKRIVTSSESSSE